MDQEKIQSKILTRGIWSAILVCLPLIGIFVSLSGIKLSKKYFKNGGRPTGKVVTGRVLSISTFWVDIYIFIAIAIAVAILITSGDLYIDQIIY